MDRALAAAASWRARAAAVSASPALRAMTARTLSVTSRMRALLARAARARVGDGVVHVVVVVAAVLLILVVCRVRQCVGEGVAKEKGEDALRLGLGLPVVGVHADIEDDLDGAEERLKYERAALGDVGRRLRVKRRKRAVQPSAAGADMVAGQHSLVDLLVHEH